ncbi:glutathione S-transferase C-terminal domain-containing protein [Phenylobacterium sp. J367]|uniref:glutathione S-transferase C-terminal domain-containing protein n=1 Tax=Phenylobacterium sp. J367 TaxID=2898435 RepID=UPI002151CD17|nr:glutathione S-transferase C-terminal domain-containing protein [Phenylobacterium sp. J367]MCR5878335.1 glutathione S-transferase C-terminal domain-containing protein [Phenylobacterium sp. J367]
MLENQLGWVIGYFRWLTPENFARGPAHFFDGAPPEARDAIHEEVLREVRAAMRAQGVARHSDAEIVELGLKSLAALSEILGDQRFLFGDRPSGADATALGMLTALYTPFFPCELQERAQGFANPRRLHRPADGAVLPRLPVEGGRRGPARRLNGFNEFPRRLTNRWGTGP